MSKPGLDKIALVNSDSTPADLTLPYLHTALLFALKVMPKNKAVCVMTSNFLEMLMSPWPQFDVELL